MRSGSGRHVVILPSSVFCPATPISEGFESPPRTPLRRDKSIQPRTHQCSRCRPPDRHALSVPSRVRARRPRRPDQKRAQQRQACSSWVKRGTPGLRHRKKKRSSSAPPSSALCVGSAESGEPVGRSYPSIRAGRACTAVGSALRASCPSSFASPAVAARPFVAGACRSPPPP